MRTSPEGVEFLHGWEGCKLSAYYDSAGVLTIGWGHTNGAGLPEVYSGMQITQEEADEIFVNDIVKFEDRVWNEFGDVPQQVFDGAVSFDYNTGSIDTASWPEYWKIEDYETSEYKLKLWNKAGGQIVEGLVKRREAEADMIFRGDYAGRP